MTWIPALVILWISMVRYHRVYHKLIDDPNDSSDVSAALIVACLIFSIENGLLLWAGTYDGIIHMTR